MIELAGNFVRFLIADFDASLILVDGSKLAKCIFGERHDSIVLRVSRLIRSSFVVLHDTFNPHEKTIMSVVLRICRVIRRQSLNR